jgi:hypothetical protein
MSSFLISETAVASSTGTYLAYLIARLSDPTIPLYIKEVVWKTIGAVLKLTHEQETWRDGIFEPLGTEQAEIILSIASEAVMGYAADMTDPFAKKVAYASIAVIGYLPALYLVVGWLETMMKVQIGDPMIDNTIPLLYAQKHRRMLNPCEPEVPF